MRLPVRVGEAGVLALPHAMGNAAEKLGTEHQEGKHFCLGGGRGMTLPSREDTFVSQSTNQSFSGGQGRVGKRNNTESMMEAWKMASCLR